MKSWNVARYASPLRYRYPLAFPPKRSPDLSEKVINTSRKIFLPQQRHHSSSIICTHTSRNNCYRMSPISFKMTNYSQIPNNGLQGEHRAFIALGSNLGDRIAMIEKACKEMELRGDIHIVRTSSLWETKAMYVLDQGNFINGTCEVS